MSHKVLCVEGNNGGDYVCITPQADNTVHLEIGHCCVVTVDMIIPVEFLTKIITDGIANGFKNHVEYWGDDFGTKLLKQVKKL